MKKQVLCSLLLFLGVATASQAAVPGAAEQLFLNATQEVGFLLRMNEKCKLDQAELEQAVDILGDEGANEAERLNADRAEMARYTHAGGAQADKQHPRKPPADVCAEVREKLLERAEKGYYGPQL